MLAIEPALERDTEYKRYTFVAPVHANAATIGPRQPMPTTNRPVLR